MVQNQCVGGAVRFLPRTLNLTAAGNTISHTVELSGRLDYIDIIPPSTGTYDFEFQDDEGAYIYADTGISGFQSFRVDKAIHGPHTIRLTNCPNGAWKVKLRWQPD